MLVCPKFWISAIYCAIFLILGFFFVSPVFAAMNFVLDGIKDNPSIINSDQEIEAFVSFSNVGGEKTYYLQGVFKHSSGNYYFGYTWSNNAWYKYGDNFDNFHKVDIKESTWSGVLKVKPDPEAKGFKGTGEYIFKVFRYCSSQTHCGETEELTINIEAPPSPSPSPSPSLSPSPSPSPEQSSSLSPSPNPSLASSPMPLSSLSPSPKPVKVTGATLLGKILGEEESSPAGFYPWEATEEGKSQEATETSRAKFIPKLFLGLGLIFLLFSGGFLWYNRFRDYTSR